MTDDELSTFTEQLAAILDHADDLAALDLEGREALGSPHRLVNVLRPDEVGATLDRAEVLGSAPSADSGQFRVPSILGDGS